MKQLSGMDASFLYLESGRSFGHISGVVSSPVPRIRIGRPTR